MNRGVSIIQHYFPDTTSTQLEQFEILSSAYTAWNTKINVISRKDIENIYIHHFLHSLAIAKIHPFIKSQKILDVGTGGGFPGVPLAVLFPEVEFYLIDSIQKKIKVVQEVCSIANIKNIKAQAIRAEELKGSFDFVVSRAVTKLDVFIPWVYNKIRWDKKGNGILYLKGGDLQEELFMIDPKKFQTKIHDIYSVFPEPFFETKKLIHVFKS